MIGEEAWPTQAARGRRDVTRVDDAALLSRAARTAVLTHMTRKSVERGY